jgi:hypothetical protein
VCDRTESRVNYPSVLGTGKRKARANRPAPPLLLNCFYLQPEHESQHSADAQQVFCAALAEPAIPSEITAINNAIFNAFIFLLLLRSGKSYSHADAIVRHKENPIQAELLIFLNAKDVYFPEDVATSLPGDRFARMPGREIGRRRFEIDNGQNGYENSRHSGHH